jgi:hypothetical protein
MGSEGFRQFLAYYGLGKQAVWGSSKAEVETLKDTSHSDGICSRAYQEAVQRKAGLIQSPEQSGIIGQQIPWAPSFFTDDQQRLEAKKILKGDDRLSRVDRIVILDMVSSRIEEVREKGVLISDLVGECVEQHISKKGKVSSPQQKK